jgi:hypothetical protein
MRNTPLWSLYEVEIIRETSFNLDILRLFKLRKMTIDLRDTASHVLQSVQDYMRAYQNDLSLMGSIDQCLQKDVQKVMVEKQRHMLKVQLQHPSLQVLV